MTDKTWIERIRKRLKICLQLCELETIEFEWWWGEADISCHRHTALATEC